MCARGCVVWVWHAARQDSGSDLASVSGDTILAMFTDRDTLLSTSEDKEVVRAGAPGAGVGRGLAGEW